MGKNILHGSGRTQLLKPQFSDLQSLVMKSWKVGSGVELVGLMSLSLKILWLLSGFLWESMDGSD
jgi:hypothetical protein